MHCLGGMSRTVLWGTDSLEFCSELLDNRTLLMFPVERKGHRFRHTPSHPLGSGHFAGRGQVLVRRDTAGRAGCGLRHDEFDVFSVVGPEQRRGPPWKEPK